MCLFFVWRVRVRAWLARAAYVETVAGSATSGWLDGPGLSASFSTITSLVAVSDQVLLVTEADGLLRTIRTSDSTCML